LSEFVEIECVAVAVPETDAVYGGGIAAQQVGEFFFLLLRWHFLNNQALAFFK
jgi:hypothetical protein